MKWSWKSSFAVIIGLLAALGCGNGDDGRTTEPRTFNSELSLEVWIWRIDEDWSPKEDEDGDFKEPEALGTTPATEPITIPAGVLWWVEPTDDVEMPALAAEIEAKRIPGVRLPRNTTDADLAHLSGMTELRALILFGTQVTDAGLEHLKGMTQMRKLDLDGTQVTDAGLKHLRGMTEMRVLWLMRTQVTDAGLKHLKGMTEMRGLDLRGTQVTDEGVAELQKALPDAYISR